MSKHHHRSPECQKIEATAAEIATLSRATVRLLRELRLAMTRCAKCPDTQECGLQASVNTQVRTAIAEVWSEWADNNDPA